MYEVEVRLWRGIWEDRKENGLDLVCFKGHLNTGQSKRVVHTTSFGVTGVVRGILNTRGFKDNEKMTLPVVLCAGVGK